MQMRVHAQSFQPLEGERAHTLILGTMPGQQSLSAQAYYAHKRNAFWPIMQAILTGTPPTFDILDTIDYATRCAQLMDHGYAVWDVLARCDRPGSLDSKIVRTSEEPNDIVGLLQRHPELQHVACNGKTAEKLFMRHIQPALAASDIHIRSASDPTRQTRSIQLVCLPSTSPAMASLTLAQKHQLWADGLLG